MSQHDCVNPAPLLKLSASSHLDLLSSNQQPIYSAKLSLYIFHSTRIYVTIRKKRSVAASVTPQIQ